MHSISHSVVVRSPTNAPFGGGPRGRPSAGAATSPWGWRRKFPTVKRRPKLNLLGSQILCSGKGVSQNNIKPATYYSPFPMLQLCKNRSHLQKNFASKEYIIHTTTILRDTEGRSATRRTGGKVREVEGGGSCGVEPEGVCDPIDVRSVEIAGGALRRHRRVLGVFVA